MMNRTVLGLLLLAALFPAGCNSSGSGSAPASAPTTGESASKEKEVVEAAPTPEEAAKAKAIIERAVKAHAETTQRLQKLRTFTAKGQGIAYMASGTLEGTRSATFAFPDSFRLTMELNVEGVNRTSIITFQAYTAWAQQAGQPAEEMGPENSIEIGNTVHAYWLATLMPLNDGSVTIGSIPNLTAAGKSMVGIRALRRGRPQVNLYFDNETGLLGRLTYADEIPRKIVKELQFGGYREFQGIKLPTTEVELHDGVKKASWTISEYQFLEKLDPGAFKLPKQ
jgi:hypothetical protein